MDSYTAGIVLIGGLCCGSGVLWLWIGARRRLLQRWYRSRSRPAEVSGWAIGLVAAWLVLRALVAAWIWLEDLPPQPFDPDRVLSAMRVACVEHAIEFAFLWLALTGAHRGTARSLGIDGTHLGRQVCCGGLTVMAAWLPVFLTLFATYPLRSEEGLHPVLRLLHEQPSLETYGWAVLSAVVLAPLFEELVFRVILQSWMAARLGATAGLLLASAVFAAVHGFPDSLAIFPLALVLGFVWYCTRRYWTIVVAHALFNTVMLVLDSVLPEG